MAYTDEQLQRIVSYDALDAAERFTGGDYKTDKATEALGVLLHMDSVKVRREALTKAGDSHFSMQLAEYQRVLADEGFQMALDLPFDGSPKDDGTPMADHLFVYWKQTEGVVLVFDTYWGNKSVNGGKFYYNWRPSEDEGWHQFTSGGFSGDRLWVGDHDCREAIRLHLRQLRNHGAFVTPWQKTHLCFWLTHYMDWKIDGDKSAHAFRVTAERVAMLPKELQTIIGTLKP